MRIGGGPSKWYARARSAAPERTSGRLSSGSTSSTVSSTPGCSLVNRSSAAGNSRCPPLVKVATVIRSVRAVPSRPISSSALASSAVIASLASASTRPASVNSTPRVLRRTTATPSPRSSALICWDTADGVNRSAAAARLKLPCRATSRKTASRRTSIISSP